ncbi:MAG: DUF5518 domain-containing protein [Salinigranum sp.]
MADDTLVHALVGAAVSVVLSFVLFSPVLGGAVAGYLHGTDGLRVGAISGLLAAIPLALFLALVGLVGGFFVAVPAMGGVGPGFHPGVGLGVTGAFLLLVLFGAAVAAVYTVALSAVGGLLGVYVVDEL